jgi:hypothetical protein
MRPADVLGTEVSGTILRNYSLVGSDVAQLCRQCRAELGMIIMTLILEVQKIIGFNFEQKTP